MNYLKNIKLAMFDMDGTILDSNYLWFNGELDEKVFKNFNFDLTPKIRKEINEEPNFKLALKKAIDKYNIKTKVDDLIDLYIKYSLNEYKEKIKFKLDAFEYLKYLKKNNIKIIITTAAMKICINIFLKTNNLKNFFDYIITTEEIGKDKDQPDIYLKVMKKFNCPTNEIIAFEDSLTPIKTLKKLGIKTYGIYDFYMSDKQEEIKKTCDVYIKDYKSLY